MSKKDRPRNLLIDAFEDREKCPEVFLFTSEEIKLIYKLRESIIELGDKFRKIPENNITPEIQEQLLKDCREIFKRKRVPLNKILKFVDRAQQAAYWTASLYSIDIATKQGTFESYKITTSNPSKYPERIVNPQNCPAFYEAQDTAARARALGLEPEIYLYAGVVELDILRTFKTVSGAFNILSKDDREEQATPADLTGQAFLTVINSTEMNAFFSIGENARKEPKIIKKPDETGRQITIYEYLTNLGDTIQFKDLDPLAGQGLVSVGDPNTDKLLLQAESRALTTGEKVQNIPMSEFMQLRELSDKKTANEKARAACDTLLRCHVQIAANTKGASLYGGFHYVQECYIEQRKGRGGNYIHLVFSDRVFEHLMTMKKNGQQIEQLDTDIMKIPDNQGTAYNIARKFNSHLRINAEKPTAHRLSVKTLLSYCPRLPLYPENPEQFGTTNYIRKPSEAQTRIIQPFISALKYLVDRGMFEEYHFIHEGGKSLTAAEQKRMETEYDFFITLNVEAILKNAPDYSHLIESKSKHIEKTKKGKGKRKRTI